MKKNISVKRTQITNNLMHYIYSHIDCAINLDIIIRDIKISKFHLHRIFKEEFGVNIYSAIKSIRLQKAASLLVTNKRSTISEIAANCGYSTQTSFIRAFKKRFNMTPTKWRKGGFITYSNAILSGIGTKYTDGIHDFNLTPKITKIPSLQMYYIRHRGYNTGILRCWRKLQTFVLNQEIKNFWQIAIYHDNPAIVPLDECQYIACVQTDEITASNSNILPSFTINTGVYADFYITCYRDDILRLIQWAYHKWLPNSGYETTTSPSFIIYENTNFINDTDLLTLHYYVPIVLI